MQRKASRVWQGSLAAGAALTFLALANLGCDMGACTLLACGVPLEVKVEHAGGWPAGAYILEVDQDGVVGSCEFSSPPACEGWQPVCNPVRGWELDLDDCIEPYTGQTLRIAFGGWGAPEPASVTVRVSLDGVEIGAETFVPTYERFRPNGPDCDPVCQRADPVTLTLQ